MNGNYHFNNFYAQERINARLNEAESHRLASHAKEENGIGFAFSDAVSRVFEWVDRAADWTAQSLETLGEARVASLQR